MRLIALVCVHALHIDDIDSRFCWLAAHYVRTGILTDSSCGEQLLP